MDKRNTMGMFIGQVSVYVGLIIQHGLDCNPLWLLLPLGAMAVAAMITAVTKNGDLHVPVAGYVCALCMQGYTIWLAVAGCFLFFVIAVSWLGDQKEASWLLRLKEKFNFVEFLSR